MNKISNAIVVISSTTVHKERQIDKSSITSFRCRLNLLFCTCVVQNVDAFSNKKLEWVTIRPQLIGKPHRLQEGFFNATLGILIFKTMRESSQTDLQWVSWGRASWKMLLSHRASIPPSPPPHSPSTWPLFQLSEWIGFCKMQLNALRSLERYL